MGTGESIARNQKLTRLPPLKLTNTLHRRNGTSVEGATALLVDTLMPTTSPVGTRLIVSKASYRFWQRVAAANSV